MKINLSILFIIIAPLCLHSSSGALQPKLINSGDKLPGIKIIHVPVGIPEVYNTINDAKDELSGRYSGSDIDEHNGRRESIRPISYGTHTGGIVGPGGQIVAYVDSGSYKGSKGYMTQFTKNNSVSMQSGNIENHIPNDGSGANKLAFGIVGSQAENKKEYRSDGKGYEREFGSSPGETMGFLNTGWNIPSKGYVGYKPYSGSTSGQRETHKGSNNQTIEFNNVDFSQSELRPSDVQSMTIIGSDKVKPEIGSKEHADYDGIGLQTLDKDAVIHKPKDGTESIQNTKKDSVGYKLYSTLGLKFPNKGSVGYNHYEGSGEFLSPNEDSEGFTDRTGLQEKNKDLAGLNLNDGIREVQKPNNESVRYKPYDGKVDLQKPNKDLGGYKPNDGTGGLQKLDIYSSKSKPHDSTLGIQLPVIDSEASKPKNDSNKDKEGFKSYDGSGSAKIPAIDSGLPKYYDRTEEHQETNIGYTGFKPLDGSGGLPKPELSSGVSSSYTGTEGHQEINKKFKPYGGTMGIQNTRNDSEKSKPNNDTGRHQETNNVISFKPFDVTGGFQEPYYIDSGESKSFNSTGRHQVTKFKDNVIYKLYNDTGGLQKPDISSGVSVLYIGTEGHQEISKDNKDYKRYDGMGEIKNPVHYSEESKPYNDIGRHQVTNINYTGFKPYDVTEGLVLQKPYIDSGVSESHNITRGHHETIKGYAGYKPYDDTERHQNSEMSSGVSIVNDGTRGHQETSNDNEDFKPYEGTGGIQESINVFTGYKQYQDTGEQQTPEISLWESVLNDGTRRQQETSDDNEDFKHSGGTEVIKEIINDLTGYKPHDGSSFDGLQKPYIASVFKPYNSIGEFQETIKDYDEYEPYDNEMEHQIPEIGSGVSKFNDSTSGHLGTSEEDEDVLPYNVTGSIQENVNDFAVYKPYDGFEGLQKTWDSKLHFGTVGHQEIYNDNKKNNVIKELGRYTGDDHLEGSGFLEHVTDKSGELVGYIGIFSDSIHSTNNFNGYGSGAIDADGTGGQIFLNDLEHYEHSVNPNMEAPLHEKQAIVSKEHAVMYSDFKMPNKNVDDYLYHGNRFDHILRESEEADISVKLGVNLGNFDDTNENDNDGMHDWYEDTIIPKDIFNDFKIPKSAFTWSIKYPVTFSKSSYNDAMDNSEDMVEGNNRFSDYSEDFDRQFG